ncbi:MULTISPECIES: hypothetical protein [unclassified Nodularia (in: cyanobacteria)]|nr:MULTISPECIES: hypothetical protein [unclassified Nodularia (in: cyanobacteria)]
MKIKAIIHPAEEGDYEIWYAGFSGRLPTQRQYDDGFVSLEHCDR